MKGLRADLRRAVEDTLREAGVERWHREHAKAGHIKYRFEWRDREIMYVTSATPSDWRVIENAVAELRRVLGIRRRIHKNPENRAKPRRSAKKRAPECPKLTPGKDPWEPLAQIVFPERPAAPSQQLLPKWYVDFINGLMERARKKPPQSLWQRLSAQFFALVRRR